MNEMICPFCGASVNGVFMFDATEFSCGTFMSTMRIEPSYHQSVRCKENSKKKENENEI